MIYNIYRIFQVLEKNSVLRCFVKSVNNEKEVSVNELFCESDLKNLLEFYETREEWKNILHYRTLTPEIAPVENIFFGDSITCAWPLHEFFPGVSLLNRGIPGDNVIGLHYRLQGDVLAYSPKRVFMMIGINGIDSDQSLLLARIEKVASLMAEAGIRVYPGSILPLRDPDAWDRFQYQEKIVKVNQALREWSADHAAGFLDYHTLLKDETGQLAAEYAQPDGTHLTFAAYRRMSALVAPVLNEE